MTKATYCTFILNRENMFAGEMCKPGLLYGRPMKQALDESLGFDAIACTGNGTVDLTDVGVTIGIICMLAHTYSSL